MDESGEFRANRTKVSGYQEEFLAFLDGLGAPPDVEFGEEVGAVGFDGIYGDEQPVGDLLVGEALGHEFEDFVLAFADSESVEAGGVELEAGDRDEDSFSPG